MDETDSFVHTELAFKGSNPGATKYGNFINYYQFNPAQNRLKLLPLDIWDILKNATGVLTVLDIGCNAGDLTIELHKGLKASLGRECRVLAVDIDPILIQRAREKSPSSEINFLCCDFMEPNERRPLGAFLRANGAKKFALTFCFSLTMWIHLNHGDEGLKSFLREVCSMSAFVVVEPQPWKCYKTAVRRMRRSRGVFPEFEDLKIRGEVEDFVERFIVDECGGEKVAETERTEWGRRLLMFKVNSNC